MNSDSADGASPAAAADDGAASPVSRASTGRTGRPAASQDPIQDPLTASELPGGEELDKKKRRALQSPSLMAEECEHAKLVACQDLRMLYMRGALDGKPDAAKALLYGKKANELMNVACQAGERQHCLALARSFLHSLPRDPDRARQLFDEACSSADANSCWSGAEAFDAPGDPRAKVIAQGFYRRAVMLTEPLCNKGDSNACLRMGKAYLSGAGVTQDAGKADYYFGKAARK